MPFENVRGCLADILDSICAIERFVAGMDFAAYAAGERTLAAVERKLLIVS